jgi:YesN/AraC family two-component response regulator
MRELARHTPRPLIIVLSLFDDPKYLQQAAESGAAAYVLKQSAPTFLITAIRDAVAGQLPHQFQAADHGHDDVGNHHVGRGLLNQVQGLQPVGGFTNDPKIRLRPQQSPDAPPNQGMVLDDENAGSFHGT